METCACWKTPLSFSPLTGPFSVTPACRELRLPPSEPVLPGSPGDPASRALPGGASQRRQQYRATRCQLLRGQERQR